MIEDCTLTFLEAMKELVQGKEIISEVYPNMIYYLDENDNIMIVSPSYCNGDKYYIIEDGYFDKQCIKGKWKVYD